MIALPAEITQPLSEIDRDFTLAFTADGLPDADLAVTGFRLEEAISTLFQAEIALASPDPGLDLTALLDKPARLTVLDRYGPPRHVHGVLALAERGDTGAHHTRYSVLLMPALHRLRFSADCRIFQTKSVPEIVEAVLKENGVSAFRFALTEQHPAREYCVQYRETHLAFVERLMAEEGIAYHFEHTEGAHTLVLTDATKLALDAPGAEAIEYNAEPGGTVKGPHVSRFTWREVVAPSDVVQRDHFFRNPVHDFEARAQASVLNGLTRKLEMYDYPGRYKADAVGRAFTRYRLEGYRDEASHGEGAGRCARLLPGHRFALSEHPDPALSRRFLVVAASHAGSQPGAVEGDAGDGGAYLTTSFRVIRHDTPYRPDAPAKPRVEGPQMAIVTGPAGEEIHCDAFGRVKVRFPWDRSGKADDTASCWIRVSQGWAGASWGQIALPRVGQHVIVDFLEGDPDQPIITGRAYNAREPVPYPLPANKTRMTIKSKTHKGEGFNELRFEDEQGREEVFVHAQRDMRVKVRHDRRKRVDHDQSESIGHDKAIDVGGNHVETIAQNKQLTVGLNMNRTVGLTSSEEVGVMKNTVVGANQNVIVGALKVEKIGKKYRLEVGEELEIVVGKSRFVMDKEGNITLQGETHTHSASGPIQMNGKTIDLN
ncbi:type VI secretion system Vgr family protein [Methylobacterium radiotolerans]|uniref:type VI secretion system Vgr family protein n=2 Tax=Methylobacterium TaxID=407 RepID=UPI0009FA0EF0|nr:type VI secretion system tip protein VgrG [Methylobacterium radiotolerans]